MRSWFDSSLRNYGDVVKWPNTSVCLTDIFAGSNLAVLATYSIRLVGLWRLPYKQKQPWFESKIEYYRELAQLEEQQSPKLRVGCSRHSFPANKLFMGMLKSWRSSSVCKTDGYAFGGSNPPIPTTYSILAQW